MLKRSILETTICTAYFVDIVDLAAVVLVMLQHVPIIICNSLQIGTDYLQSYIPE